MMGQPPWVSSYPGTGGWEMAAARGLSESHSFLLTPSIYRTPAYATVTGNMEEMLMGDVKEITV